MRSTCEIIADVKDGIEVPYDELKMACLVQSALLFFYKKDTKSLLKGGISSDLTKSMNYSDSETSSKELGEPTWYWKGIHADPMKWLSPEDIPGTEEWKKFHGMCKKIFDKVMENK